MSSMGFHGYQGASGYNLMDGNDLSFTHEGIGTSPQALTAHADGLKPPSTYPIASSPPQHPQWSDMSSKPSTGYDHIQSTALSAPLRQDATFIHRASNRHSRSAKERSSFSNWGSTPAEFVDDDNQMIPSGKWGNARQTAARGSSQLGMRLKPVRTSPASGEALHHLQQSADVVNEDGSNMLISTGEEGLKQPPTPLLFPMLSGGDFCPFRTLSEDKTSFGALMEEIEAIQAQEAVLKPDGQSVNPFQLQLGEDASRKQHLSQASDPLTTGFHTDANASQYSILAHGGGAGGAAGMGAMTGVQGAGTAEMSPSFRIRLSDRRAGGSQTIEGTASTGFNGLTNNALPYLAAGSPETPPARPGFEAGGFRSPMDAASTGGGNTMAQAAGRATTPASQGAPAAGQNPVSNTTANRAIRQHLLAAAVEAAKGRTAAFESLPPQLKVIAQLQLQALVAQHVKATQQGKQVGSPTSQGAGRANLAARTPARGWSADVPAETVAAAAAAATAGAGGSPSKRVEAPRTPTHHTRPVPASPSSPAGVKKKGRRSRRMTCRNCGAHQTPQWRCGPEGPRTLCNACGVRYKKGLPLDYMERKKSASKKTAKPGSKAASAEATKPEAEAADAQQAAPDTAGTAAAESGGAMARAASSPQSVAVPCLPSPPDDPASAPPRPSASTSPAHVAGRTAAPSGDASSDGLVPEMAGEPPLAASCFDVEAVPMLDGGLSSTPMPASSAAAGGRLFSAAPSGGGGATSPQQGPPCSIQDAAAAAGIAPSTPLAAGPPPPAAAPTIFDTGLASTPNRTERQLTPASGAAGAGAAAAATDEGLALELLSTWSMDDTFLPEATQDIALAGSDSLLHEVVEMLPNAPLGTGEIDLDWME